MTLAPGTKHGLYEIVAPLGAGGMGEVWRARDVRLRREVAIKALPASFAADAERLARFEREARLLAALNHPNIAAIYGLEEADGLPYLVMECVEGESLAQKLAAGPLPVEDALSVAAQIAAGLEAAHGAGVIHRDLKPANVMIRPDGSVKILDLGLARSIESTAATDPSLSPTIATPATSTGVILGTAAYMSPEQARGKQVDKRTDIFSFGCVLYECLTAQRAFPGETVSDSLAAILRAEPDWTALPVETPPLVRRLLRRCLEKDPKRRLHDIADARIDVEEALARPGTAESEAVTVTVARRPRGSRLAGSVALLAIGLAAGAMLQRFLLRSDRVRPGPALRSVLPLPPDTRVALAGRPEIAVAPDGRTIVFRAETAGRVQLYRRRLDRAEAEPIPGTEGGSGPFFSPDGQWLGFQAQLGLNKIPIDGGTAIGVTRVSPVAAGAAWDDDGTIVFAASVNTGLFRVSAAGGAPQRLTKLDSGEHAHRWPQILPDGRGILLSIVRGQDFADIAGTQIVVLDPKTGKRRVVLEGSAFARFAAPGWLVFVRKTSVFAAPFDLETLEVTGPPIPVPEEIAIESQLGIPNLAVSRDGTLVYLSGPPSAPPPTTVLELDRTGRAVPVPLPPGRYFEPRIASDGKRLALSRCENLACKLVVYDVERRMVAPVTTQPGRFGLPVWSADGRLLAYTRFYTPPPRVGIVSADGSGESRTPTVGGDRAEFANSFSPDGRVLAYTVAYGPATSRMGQFDIWLAPLDGSPRERPWFESPFNEFGAVFSPDGRWIAYVSDESGRREVYVRPYPGPGARVRISVDGGAEPVWSRGGRELLYREGNRFFSVDVGSGAVLSPGAPRLLFTADVDRAVLEDPRAFDASADGNRIVAIRTETIAEPERRLAVVTNWFATLAGRGDRE